MNNPIGHFAWKPSTVSWLSFVIMGFIVGGLGLTGTAYVFNYIHDRSMEHDIGHNKEIAHSILAKLELNKNSDAESLVDILPQAVSEYQGLGFRILLIDKKNSMLAIDSEAMSASARPISESWLATAVGADGSKTALTNSNGGIYAAGEDRQPVLIWLQEVQAAESGRWLLGIGRGKQTLTDFMGDLHWQLDRILLLTYLLIAVLGYFSMRSIGRIYEKRLESQIRERTLELIAAHNDLLHKTRLETIGQTASVLTHEMRNPLASIKLVLSSLKGSVNLAERENRRIELVLGEVDRLDGLLSETLDYVRPVEISAEPLDLYGLVVRVLKQQEPLIDEKGIRIQLEGCSEGATLYLDQAQMHQVLLNLINNAIEACPANGEISLSLRRENNGLILKISNDGEAPGEKVLQKAFEPFFTTKPKGTGLGLGLVKRVVEEHGGSVVLSAGAGGGTTLTVTIPSHSF